MAGWRPLDTSDDAYAMQRQIYQQIGARARLDVMFRLNDTVRRLALSGIRARHPQYTETEVQQAYARLVLGETLVRTVWPDRALVDP